jgi:type VI secretion system protein ImpL
MEVNRRFAELRRFVNGPSGDGSNAPILQEMKEFNKIKDLLERAASAKENRQPMPDTSVLMSLVNLPSGRLPEPFGGVVKSIASVSREAIATAKVAQGTTNLIDEVTVFCNKAIAGHYPFDPGATKSVTEGAFSDMFGPGGRMERFRQQQGSGAALPPGFDHARTIKDAFFRRGDRPEISFTIKPMVMDGSITNLLLNIGEQQIRYAHGASTATSVTWPASDTKVRLFLSPPIASGVNEINENGLWALHRLFDRHGQMRKGNSPDVFEVEINVGGRRATFEVQPTGAFNPFNLPELRKFRCPQIMPRG